MSPINTNDLNRIFEKLDQNGDGFVSLDELKWLLETIGIRASQDELQSLVGKKSLDLIDFMLFYDTIIKQNINGDDELEKDEVLQDNNLENDLAKTFDVYDVNGDGYISCEELQSVLSRLGFWNEYCGRDCRSMIKRYDMNSDGVLDFEEFKNMMLPYQFLGTILFF
ncbi:calcium-binding EF-hand family protein [Actinidia rufa]|uniref:Calcium-binding EF-hand family protein n=1 Tax=Actinidia rufa TaxID=165716 RepID=A0A7J0DLD5_9ERIC|nr:calcium-binding EF-hand family protein [Actinidia rufa]